MGRGGLGLSWISVPASAEDVGRVVAELRVALDPLPCAVLDSPAPVERPWPIAAPALARLLGRVKAKFDPGAVCNPGREPWSLA